MYDSSGSVLKELFPAQPLRYNSPEFVSNSDHDSFQKSHGYYGDTCDDDLGGIIWKESVGIHIIIILYEF